MKLWKQLVVSFVVAWMLPPIPIIILNLIESRDVFSFFLYPTFFYFHPEVLSDNFLWATGAVFSNALIIFGLLVFVVHLLKKYRTSY